MGEVVKKQTFLRSASCFYNSRNWVVAGAQEQKSKDTQKKITINTKISYHEQNL